VLSEFELARSPRARVWIAYLDAFPEGFELQLAAVARIPWKDLVREGDYSPDVFGRQFPMVGERRDVLPDQLLRLGVAYADGRRATSVSGHDRPPRGPSLWPLSGGARGSGRSATGAAPSEPPEVRLHQGYWVSPLPPPGPVVVACEWPVAQIGLTRCEIDARSILEAAERAQAMFPRDGWVSRDGRRWRLGGEEEVAWINAGTSVGREIDAAIPLIYEAYCTVEVPPRDARLAVHERALLDLLSRHGDPDRWWLGYLDTGASDVVFPYAPRVSLYANWRYVLVMAGSQQATRWRDPRGRNRTGIPDLIFSADRSWLLSTLWDDEWSSIGGSESLVESVLSDPVLGRFARRVRPGEDATPPGHVAR
jgi:hypothetical protein